MKELLLWGGTGHAKVLREALDPALWKVVAIVDNRELPSPIDGVPMLHGEAGLRHWLSARTRAQSLHFAMAIGGSHGADRVELAGKLAMLGMHALAVIHPRAFVARDAKLGPGVQVLAQSAVCAGARLGSHVIVNTGATVDHDCVLGDGVHIGPGAHLAGEIEVGGCAFIGCGAAVLPRVRIGKGAIVGAGAVVIRDVEDGQTVAGNPARPV